jgi:hypothetical protein
MMSAATTKYDDYDWNFTIDDSVGATDSVLMEFFFSKIWDQGYPYDIQKPVLPEEWRSRCIW